TPRPFVPSATPLVTAADCLRVEFLEDVTIPDDTRIKQNTEFVKTWKVRNSGTCTWTEDFSLVFAKGEQMGGPDKLSLNNAVKPGEEAEISVELTAPFNPGKWRGDWMLADAAGNRFGPGSDGQGVLWVKIDVKEIASGKVYSFYEGYCSAEWHSSAGDLDCPGKEGDEKGFVLRLDDPELENRPENEPTLWTNPEMKDDGWIQGEFPAVEIKDGDHFLADVGCMGGFKRCNVTFILLYRKESGSVKELGRWKEEYDGEITNIDIDLSEFDDKKIGLILRVETNGPYKEDAAFWLLPHINR
ncbi:MAG: hypothetical protein L0Z70_15925, partial [Chloroflexi bacterium]|nr:hypothetical protein [Chloroflexota bacterium]